MQNSYPNRQWIYVKRPEGRVGPEHYELREEVLVGNLAANEVIVRASIISVDPYIRIQQHERNTYDVPHPLGIVQRAGVVGQVVASASPLFAEGDWVSTYSGWQLYARCHHSELTKLDPSVAPVSTALGVLGMPGRTAWFGLMDAGRPRPGDTLVVSGAAGAVGSLVAQFGKRAGCRVVGIAGGPDKCKFLTDTLKLDEAVDYRAYSTLESLSDAIQAATGGVDVYFDNVGGRVTDAVIPLIKRRARIVICGAISQYDGGLDKPDLGPRFLQHMLFQRATIQGILARDFINRMDEMVATVAPWVRSGELHFHETYVDGFDELPAALNSLFDGRNLGKLLVRV
ncbi:NADP-dependent oxidoreductase [Paraburkholderia ginsengiterrae]|uniref:NADP-dependent oxidoreductase n=1 Tax=Paraburkholderia ginsengiterrae TaxID=1462993 RepID=A0A1A9N938_9BURK|nr:NADP-dependent oxidoreductase [Paraburkholderia ginsengiterrae]OAJ54930.1 NADP-dependent oxidoreductase [Paraburkholderia ginsengiterrae]OAJ61114.1 NADP-dependent oxidoreductase [Paraburkholderia ginsengiterrae]